MGVLEGFLGVGQGLLPLGLGLGVVLLEQLCQVLTLLPRYLRGCSAFFVLFRMKILTNAHLEELMLIYPENGIRESVAVSR